MVFHDDVLRFLWFLAERMASNSKQLRWMTFQLPSQEVSGDPLSLFRGKRILKFGRRLKASFAFKFLCHHCGYGS
eukprot:757697-Hanusia_phi.AAC.1